MANKLGVSVGTAYNRVRNLEATGVVKGYTVVLDPTKLGFELTAIILIQAVGSHLAEVEKEIAKTANVVAVYDIAGEYDAAVVAKFKDRSSLNDYLKKLAGNDLREKNSNQRRLEHCQGRTPDQVQRCLDQNKMK